ncbi:FCD domain-containing protein [Bradyrhizobium septentrionale]|uniref:FadR family transcriptional regulator n=1 Tax=Bradyrhizobium septentrionale TaxID=1404411 RepID=A0A974A4I6_9BRAD|nr:MULTISPECIES: FCD domain-containing protein [Bradyrhizobium]MCK7664653.1 FCD domain-containing protein [Bradyrhizobium sp. 2S1]UGY16836.1 FCD domain-containing protein [Bradyrhizobium septentrionale]UGY21050.1 FCD domain-containing protein [Bradyrhizobium septentrionale]
MNQISATRQSAIQILRNYLKERGFGPNEQLPPERQLAEDLNLTRSRLRTSLAKLEDEGVIWRHVGQGTFMSAPPESLQVSSFGDPGPVLETNPSEILEARLSLEPQIAFLAAQRATGSDVERMEEILEESKNKESWEEWRALDQAFHLAIGQASKNQLLLKLLVMIQESQTQRNWGRLSDLPAAKARRAHITHEHDAIFRAIQSREAREAAVHMRRHLEEVRKALLGPFAPI